MSAILDDIELKCHPEPFTATWLGNKTHEVRKTDDRTFMRWNTLLLREWDPERQVYSGRWIRTEITHITRGGEWGLPADVVVMSVRTIDRGVS